MHANTFAARAGRWSAQHRKKAIWGWIAFVVVAFPDPNNYGVGKLYTTAFYRLLARHLSRDGLVVVQATSPLFARKSYWCIEETMHQAGLTTYPYHLYVPSFGEWGFVLASLDGGYTPPTSLPSGL